MDPLGLLLLPVSDPLDQAGHLVPGAGVVRQVLEGNMLCGRWLTAETLKMDFLPDMLTAQLVLSGTDWKGENISTIGVPGGTTF